MDLGVIEVLAIIGALTIVYFVYRVVTFFRPRRHRRLGRW